MEISGVHAYCQRSVAAGNTVHFRVSSTVPCEMEVCRLGKVDQFDTDEVLHSFGRLEPMLQPIHPGSYIHIERDLSSAKTFDQLTLECWIRPWSWETDQGLITSLDSETNRGFALLISQGGRLCFQLADGRHAQATPSYQHTRLELREWHHVAMVSDGASAAIFVNGRFQGSWAQSGPIAVAGVPLRLGAGGAATADDFLDGDLAMPVIYNRALTAAEVQARFESRGLRQPECKSLIACWPFDEEGGDRIADASGNGCHGRIINRATWMIGGPSFRDEMVERHQDYDPRKDSTRGHGIRFASDDLYDCHWNVTREYQVPADAKSGAHVGRFQFEQNGQPWKYYVTFVVRRGKGRPPAPVLVLCSTNTWQAYSATPFAINRPDQQFWDTGGFPNAIEGVPSTCCYRNHQRGQPTYAVGMKLPWPCAGPDVFFSDPEQVNYSHLMRGERFTHNWLDETGYEYDVATDHDLHSNPKILDKYKVLIINGHSEYWSIEAYEGVDRFLRNGGNAIVLSGNTMFWRVSYDEDGTAMECRKFGTDIGGRENASVGESFHSHDHKRGSLMRYAGYPAWRVLGLECIGWWPLKAAAFGSYEATNADHEIFHTPEEVGIKNGRHFGHAAGGGLPRVGGHESDVRLGRIREITRHFPADATIPEEPAGITTLAQVVGTGRRGIDYFGRWEPLYHGVYAEMIYWERPQGGRVFHGGCIAGGWALSADAKLQTLMRNVLHRFGVRRRTG